MQIDFFVWLHTHAVPYRTGRAKDIWEDQKAGWPKNFLEEEAGGTKQLARSFIYWIEQQSI